MSLRWDEVGDTSMCDPVCSCCGVGEATREPDDFENNRIGVENEAPVATLGVWSLSISTVRRRE